MSTEVWGWLSLTPHYSPCLLTHSYSHTLLVSVILLPQVLCTCSFFGSTSRHQTSPMSQALQLNGEQDRPSLCPHATSRTGQG